MTLPKYVEKALKDRTKYQQKSRLAGTIIDEYARKIGLDENNPDFCDACLYTDIRIYCEYGCAEDITRQALLKAVAKRSENGK
ncbi:MAG: hypothetical protein J6J71_04850 [Prevotella sp.]|nr:hypothetical protein [Prevotella sp.]